MAIDVKATEQYFPVVLFIILYKVVLKFESLDEILKCDQFKSKRLSNTFLWCCQFFVYLHKKELVVSTLDFERFNCDVCFQLASIRGRYRTMRDEDNPTQENFIMGFSNPIVQSAADKTDGTVTVLGYRPLSSDGTKGKMTASIVLDEKVKKTERLTLSLN